VLQQANLMVKVVKRPELLAPAGDWECARAAVENGADAIYFGLTRFNARMRAQNFTEADLPDLMRFLHSRGVKGYVTFNTLVFTDELPEAIDYLRTIVASGVDAAIVQDVGICRLIRKLSPDFPIHASTQMTFSSASGVQFARELGCNLVVLARECSLQEIGRIRRELAAAGAEMPLEVFVHGALCVAYSGQCLTSEALGGRSANRGECAQACRMPYDLIVDGEPLDLGERRYLLSPQDLAGLSVLPELVRVGVVSLKIEGRLKTPEYVAGITRAYREALDRVIPAVAASDPRKEAALVAQLEDEARYDLEMSFSRGLHTGWLKGIDNQNLVHARFGKKRGVFLGEVSRIEGERVAVRLAAPLKPGDGVVFDRGRPEDDEEGGRVYAVEDRRREALVTFGRGQIDWSRVRPGDRLWKTSDPELERRLRQSFAGEEPRFQRPVDIEVHGAPGQPLVLLLRDGEGHIAQVASSIPLEVAHTHPLDDERLAGQLGRLGGTPFRLSQLTNHLEGAVILPVSELNRLRREAVEALIAERARPKRWQLSTEPITLAAPQKRLPVRSPQLVPLVRSATQLEAVLAQGFALVYAEFEDVRTYREAVQRAAQAGTQLFVAPPRIYKSGEEWILKQTRASDAPGYLVRNTDHLRYFATERCVADFSFNVANPLTAEYFMERYRPVRLTASYDLNTAQLVDLLSATPAGWFEVTLHQHMPLFHMEHCVFCAFLSEGHDYTDCGRPCEKHDVRLRDRVGAEHVLKADAGCRNTVFNARAQTGAEDVARLLATGLTHLRVEFVDEAPVQVQRVLDAYRRLLGGEIAGHQLWKQLKLINQLGVTRGQLRT